MDSLERSLSLSVIQNRLMESRARRSISSAARGSHPNGVSPGGRIVATHGYEPAVVRLVELETGRTIALFESPDESNLYGLVFSPDGRFLATSHTDQRVDLWDLSSIRGRLEELNLAAGLPDMFAGGATEGHGPAVDRIEVAGADRAGLSLLAVGTPSGRPS